MFRHAGERIPIDPASVLRGPPIAPQVSRSIWERQRTKPPGDGVQRLFEPRASSCQPAPNLPDPINSIVTVHQHGSPPAYVCGSGRTPPSRPPVHPPQPTGRWLFRRGRATIWAYFLTATCLGTRWHGDRTPLLPAHLRSSESLKTIGSLYECPALPAGYSGVTRRILATLSAPQPTRAEADKSPGSC